MEKKKLVVVQILAIISLVISSVFFIIWLFLFSTLSISDIPKLFKTEKYVGGLTYLLKSLCYEISIGVLFFLYLLGSIGLLRMKKWGIKLVLFFGTPSLLLIVYWISQFDRLPSGYSNFSGTEKIFWHLTSFFTLIWLWLPLVALGTILFIYLTRPKVREQFK